MRYSKKLISQFIKEMIIQPRKNAVKWSSITNQTAHLKAGYPGQHLASLITGVEGEKTGARGNDLADGSEVKTCSRVDPLDVCNNCKQPVLRSETRCSNCKSKDIRRNNDSKWLFTIRGEQDLNTLVNNPKLDRVVLVIDDYPNFDKGKFDDIQIQIFEIYPKKSRHKQFAEIMKNYYHKIYLERKTRFPEKTPAPKNFWPYEYQFYLCNPICIFRAKIFNAYARSPRLKIERWVKPGESRDEIESVSMPPKLLKIDEIRTILKKAKRNEIEENLRKGKTYNDLEKMIEGNADLESIRSLFIGINERLRQYLSLRDTDVISVSKTQYERGKRAGQSVV